MKAKAEVNTEMCEPLVIKPGCFSWLGSNLSCERQGNLFTERMATTTKHFSLVSAAKFLSSKLLFSVKVENTLLLSWSTPPLGGWLFWDSQGPSQVPPRLPPAAPAYWGHLLLRGHVSSWHLVCDLMYKMQQGRGLLRVWVQWDSDATSKSASWSSHVGQLQARNNEGRDKQKNKQQQPPKPNTHTKQIEMKSMCKDLAEAVIEPKAVFPKDEFSLYWKHLVRQGVAGIYIKQINWHR